MLGVPAARAAMVGDDIVNDVLGAQASGMTGVLVRTGKFQAADLERDDGAPDSRDRLVRRSADVAADDLTHMSDRDRARSDRLFAGIAPEYERMGAVLSFGQDARWRRTMVSKVERAPGSLVLDVASGHRSGGARAGRAQAASAWSAGPERADAPRRHPGHGEAGLGRRSARSSVVPSGCPFADETFDAVTFTYLLALRGRSRGHHAPSSRASFAPAARSRAWSSSVPTIGRFTPDGGPTRRLVMPSSAPSSRRPGGTPAGSSARASAGSTIDIRSPSRSAGGRRRVCVTSGRGPCRWVPASSSGP